jgi:hypothetical protein
MRPVTVSVGPLTAASTTNIRTASSATAGAMVLDGSLVTAGVAKLDSPRQILFTTSASEAGHTVLLSGTDRASNAQSETVALPSSATTVASALSYATVTSAVISANSTGTIAIGTNDVSESAWVRLDDWGFNTVSIQINVTGTVNYTVYETLDDPNSPTNPVVSAAVKWFQSNDATVVGATASAQSNFGFLPIFAKVVLNSGTGSLTATFVQNAGVS